MDSNEVEAEAGRGKEAYGTARSDGVFPLCSFKVVKAFTPSVFDKRVPDRSPRNTGIAV